MGLFSGLLSATIKTVTLPITIVKDIAEVTIGGEVNNTKKLIEDISNDIDDAINGF